MVSGGTFGQLREVFDKLSVGADPDLLDNLRDLPFGTYGHPADRYGVQWFFRGDGSTHQARALSLRATTDLAARIDDTARARWRT
jgi:hypothetical protein